MPDSPDPFSAALSDRYRIERELGRGGMATVFLAHDLRHDRPVALKVLYPELAQALGPERFKREIRLVARLQHPHILTVHDSGEAAGQLWFTMPFVDGESLRDRLNRERQLPLEGALRIATDAARALQYAHDHGVIHRDIKPENLLLTTDGSTLVADFGIARALRGDGDRLTQTGMSIGTPTYMSPEQAAGDRTLDARTDIYALGTVLYEMLAGEPPFTGPTAQAVIAKRFSGEVPRVRHVRPSVPEPVEHAVTRALAPIAADRFGSAAEFERALQGTVTATTKSPAEPLASAPVSASGTAPARGRPTRRQVPLPALTLALGLLIGLGALFAWRQHQSSGAYEHGRPNRVAVLPFENLGDSADAYFADGMSDAVRGKLSVLPALQVIARQSSNAYRRSAKSIEEIGKELEVQYLLTGTVRWEKTSGESRVQVSPELVHVATASTKWQQPFDAKMTNVFQVQGQIAGQVAEALDVALGAEEKQTLAQRPTENLASYDAFLRGEAEAKGLTVLNGESLNRAVAAYEQAVALDSGFAQAWARLSQAHSTFYYNVTPSPGVAEQARRAAERAVALAPDRPEGHQALGYYYAQVLLDLERAREENVRAHRLAPSNADVLVTLGMAEYGLGRWDEARDHLEQAVRLDPRSAGPADQLAIVLLYLRRYAEAGAVLDRALAGMPTHLDLLWLKTLVAVARGDLEGARAVLATAPREVEPTSLVAYIAYFFDLVWVLDDAQQGLLLRTTPSGFPGDRASWGLALAQAYALRGDQIRTRAYADSARVVFEEQLRATPNDGQRRVLLGLALAYLGRKVDAVREGERGTLLLPIESDAFLGPYVQHQLARIYLLVGEPEKALDRLEPLLKIPYYLSPGWLSIDPTFEPLRGNPRFERLRVRETVDAADAKP